MGHALDRLPLLPDSDEEVRRSIADEIARHSWMDASGVEIRVAQGVVTLTGTIFDEHLRDALRVAAQSVPGVTKVRDELTWVDRYGAPLTGA